MSLHSPLFTMATVASFTIASFSIGCGSDASPARPTGQAAAHDAGESVDDASTAANDDASSGDAAHDDAPDGGDSPIDASASVHRHYQWGRFIETPDLGMDLAPDSFFVEGDAVRLAGTTHGLVQLPATILVQAPSARATVLSGLPIAGAPIAVRRDAHGTLAGVVNLADDGGTLAAFASWDDNGSATAHTSLATNPAGAFTRLAFDPNGGFFAGVSDVAGNAAVAYDVHGAETFHQTLRAGLPPRVALAGDGTRITIEAASDATPVRVTAWREDGTARWSRDLSSGAQSYDVTTVGDRVVVARAAAGDALRVATLAAFDGAVIADVTTPLGVDVVAPLASGAMFASITTPGPLVPAQVAMLDANGNVRWAETMSAQATRIHAMQIDPAGNVYVLATMLDPSNGEPLGIKVASFSP